MGESSWTVYHVGGKLPKGKLEELKAFRDAFSIPECDEAKHGEILCWQGQLRNGDYDEFDEFLRDNGLTFHAAWAAVPGAFDSGARWWKPGMGDYPDEGAANDGGEPIVSLGDLEMAAKQGKTLETIIEELRAQSSLNVPPLEIIEETQTQAA